MNGPEHYQMAERLIEFAQGETERDKRTSLQLRAQVHATLALAAATALNDGEHGNTRADWNAWVAAASSHRGVAP